MAHRPRILIVGGGHVGLYTALRLQRKLSRGEAEIVVVDPQPHMTYQPFLPEAAAGSLSPRHVVVPLRRVLRHCRVITGSVTRVEHARKVATVVTSADEPEEMSYDVLVMAPGSISRTLPIPGLAEVGIGFKDIGEAIYLRNHVLSELDTASSVDDPDVRRRALTFLVVGGGYAGIELLAELEDMSRYAIKHYYSELDPKDARWVLVEAAERILPEVSVPMSVYTVQRLIERDIDIRLATRVESLTGGHVKLSDGTEFDADTVVWTAGVRANPVLANTDLPRDDKGRLPCDAQMRVRGVDDVWSAGDCAAVPDLSKKDPNAVVGPSAQHAVRQARRLADNIAETLRGGVPSAYKHAYAGSVASLGLHKGVAEVYGIKLKGFLAWFMHRTYHLARVPTFNRKARIVMDWTLALLFRREVIALGQLQAPRTAFEQAAGGPRDGAGVRR